MADIDKIKKDLEKNQTSLASRMTDLKSKITNARKFANKTILCDVSGSMDAYVHTDESSEAPRRAIDIVCEVLDHFKGARFYEFSTHCKRVDNIPPVTHGGTNLGGAFATVKADGIKEVVLLTDGQPDNESYALNEAKGLKLDIIYIGPAPTPPFLERLARTSGGSFSSVELIKAGSQEQLENKIRLMLNA